eukprot:UN21499
MNYIPHCLFCCHSTYELLKIANVFEHWKWKSFNITYDTTGCNLDHNGDITYIHAMPRPDGQANYR